MVIGPGAKPALIFPALALLEPGDEIIYPDPGFPTYAAMADISGATKIPVCLDEKKSFSFDLEEFDRKVGGKTKMIIINSPANPTGGVMPMEVLRHIADAAIRHDSWVLSDEIYSQLVYDGKKAPSIATLP